MIIRSLLIIVHLCQATTFPDRQIYPDLFRSDGQRRDEIDSKSVYVNFNRPVIGGFTTQWKGEFVTMIFVGNPLQFYELQVDLYTTGMWIYDQSCFTNGKCGNITGKILFDRKTSVSLRDLNQPTIIGDNVIGDYVADDIGISFYTTYNQKFGLATSVPIETPQSGVFGLGLKSNVPNIQDTPLFNLLNNAIQRSITIFADRSNHTRRLDSRQSGSMTIGKQDLVNCKSNFKFVPLGTTDAWMIRLVKVTIDNYVDYSTPLVSFRPGQIYTYAPKSWTDVFYYKIGARPADKNKTLWALDTSAGFKQIKIRFSFDQNVMLEFDLGDFLLMPNSTQDDAAAYVSIRPNPDLNDRLRPAWIFGDDLLRKYCLELSLGSTLTQIGFAENIWTPELEQNSSESNKIKFILFPFLYVLHKLIN